MVGILILVLHLGFKSLVNVLPIVAVVVAVAW